MHEEKQSGVEVVALPKRRLRGLIATVARLGRGRSKRFRAAASVIVTAVLLLASFLVYRQLTKFDPDQQCTGRQNSTIYKDAADQFGATSSSKLGNIVGKIKPMKNSQTEPNCVLIQSIYYLKINDSSKAKALLDKINSDGAKKKFVPAIADSPYNFNYVKQQIEEQETLRKQMDTNYSIINDIRNPEKKQ